MTLTQFSVQITLTQFSVQTTLTQFSVQMTLTKFGLMLGVRNPRLFSVQRNYFHTSFPGAFLKIAKSLAMSVRLSAWNNLSPTGRIFIKLIVEYFFLKSVQKIQVSFLIGRQ